jgi:hypothetical protein
LVFAPALSMFMLPFRTRGLKGPFHTSRFKHCNCSPVGSPSYAKPCHPVRVGGGDPEGGLLLEATPFGSWFASAAAAGPSASGGSDGGAEGFRSSAALAEESTMQQELRRWYTDPVRVSSNVWAIHAPKNVTERFPTPLLIMPVTRNASMRKRGGLT